MSNPPEISNRKILFFFGVVFYILENQWFGWNAKPQSFAELWCDNFVIQLIVFSIFVRKVQLGQKEVKQ